MIDKYMDLQKNLDRLENLLFHVCGCTKEEAKLVVETFLSEIDLSKELKSEIRARRYEEYEQRFKPK